MRRAISAAVVTLLIGVVGCESVTGLEDPTKLQKGTFRAEVTGAVNRSIRGDVHMFFGTSTNTGNRVWFLRLNAPPGPGADSVRFDFLKRHEGADLPAPVTWPVTTLRTDQGYTVDSVLAVAHFGVNSSDRTSYVGRSGSLTLLETADADEVAGRFEYTGQPSGSDDTISVRGSFLGDPP